MSCQYQKRRNKKFEVENTNKEIEGLKRQSKRFKMNISKN